MKSKFIAIIPARYASSRFPGKPLAPICGVPMIVRVCRRVSELGIPLAVATDDDRIFKCVTDAGFRAVMTSTNHKSGTDRVYEAYRKLDTDADVVINVQGDEPFIATSQLEALMNCFESDPNTKIATLARKFDKELGFDALFDPNLVKLTFSNIGEALYFSRSIIPYVRGYEWKEWLDRAEFYTHVGVYAYKGDVLSKLTALPQSSLELSESLEQLRWLQNGFSIKVAVTYAPTIGIDTPEDLIHAEEFMQKAE